MFKGLRSFLITLGLMFLAPFVIYQAFKNEEHPWYIPVLVIGLILAVAAIVMGFRSVKTVVDGFFSKED
ncbi:hypothetical protein GTQ38_08250 [Flavobacteriaceae bacterium R33]|uniref:Uncharacterized protein n=1 Tax=Poritiphilus flavus TaxID=2697053 RepID=A0A6L9EB45_9FLAO|nr:hypothetical protein [Poritiphilus flavus]